jgi:hypothetical protein
MFQLQDYQWLDSREARQLWDTLSVEPPVSSASALARLRSKLTVEQAGILMEQLELLTVSRRKVAEPRMWFWTRQLLEQSSDEATASESALDFPPTTKVYDLCCGAGADSIALGKRKLFVQASDKCPIAAQLTRLNCRSHGLPIQVAEGAAEAIEIEKDHYIHIDPDRRSDGKRTTGLEWMSPAWPTVRQMLDKCLGMSLKLSPGMRMDRESLNLQSELSPESIRFLSKDGSVRQQRWYWGIERWPRGTVVASMFMNAPALIRSQRYVASHGGVATPNAFANQGWFHESFLSSAIGARDLSQGSVVHVVKSYIADYDPSIRAGELAPQFAMRHGWQLIGSASGYLTSDMGSVHPMVRWFQVIENLPLDRKQLKAFSRSAKAHSWELKSRGIDIDLESLRKVLHTDATCNLKLTILFTKVGQNHRAIVGREVEC